MQILYRITEASALIGVSPTTLRRWTRRGQVPVVKTQANRWFWTPEMIARIRKQLGIE